MSNPLSPSDSELEIVFRAAGALLPDDRHGFLRALADLLRQEPVLGDGVVYRACRELQRRHWRPPRDTAASAPRHSMHDLGEAIE